MACNTSRSGPGLSLCCATMRRTAALCSDGKLSIREEVYVGQALRGGYMAGGMLGIPPDLCLAHRGIEVDLARLNAEPGGVAPALAAFVLPARLTSRACRRANERTHLRRQSRPDERLHLSRGLGEQSRSGVPGRPAP